MKKYIFTCFAVIVAACLISWGVIGHRAVAKIAENHLTPKTKEAIKDLLGRETLPDVSTWADEIRSDPNYKYTGAWHYVNVSAGLTFEQFANAVKTMPEDNVYKMVIRCELDLKNPAKTKRDKVMALKFLVHFIGDLHQPMHVSHVDDKGGNNISIWFNGADGNLHGLWDSDLIDRDGLSYEKMAATYDTATPEQIQKWQSDSLMIWIWESYQIAEILYSEAADNPKFDHDYYQNHLSTLHSRIEKGGIRLAGVLNNIFDK
ncbi:S1/P1 nuclease [Mucilaginibacter gracilis]|uniref:S1/P1 nuclease n=1 Tax=Mucilaginibacter gracilis TaxID=423350 RepID=A0A495J1Z0_9SPHI|nr:S1/P1 nuclease [Mucilaginibacter gracilis]RKR82985.1 S1/P1 nuclease [Mucilaginibacter gracilis]